MPHCMKENGQYYFWTGLVTETWRDAKGKQHKRPVLVDGRNVQQDHERFIRVSNEQDRLQQTGLDHKQARLYAIKNVCLNQSSNKPSTELGVKVTN